LLAWGLAGVEGLPDLGGHNHLAKSEAFSHPTKAAHIPPHCPTPVLTLDKVGGRRLDVTYAGNPKTWRIVIVHRAARLRVRYRRYSCRASQ
jgi:hypothetical protein